MDYALAQAREAGARGEVPVGAVVVQGGVVIAASGNRVYERQDPTAHAELLCIQAACFALQTPRLVDCDLYVTLEPCPMCAAAISAARIARLYYGAEDIKGGAVMSGVRLFQQPTCHHRPEIYEGISATESACLLKEFFKKRR